MADKLGEKNFQELEDAVVVLRRAIIDKNRYIRKLEKRCGINK